MKFLCDNCKAKYQIADEKVAGKTVRMKCRKCGHLIEVKAAVTETSVAKSAPPPPHDEFGEAEHTVIAPPPSGIPQTLKGSPSPPAARGTPLGAQKPPPRAGQAPSALAGAFQKSVHRDEESASRSLRELAAADQWYVAINGVPVGPIRMAELRRKAAIGAVTEESLVWQEGLEEWRALRTYPELADAVREAITSGRTSLTPGPERISQPPPRTAPMAPAPPVQPQAPRPMTGGIRALTPAPAPATARSNVVPITSRLATAEKLDESPVSDPFAVPAPSPLQEPPAMVTAAALSSPLASPQLAPPVLPLEQKRGGVPWIPIAMIVLAACFGVTAAYAIFFRSPVAAPAPVVIVSAPPAATAPPTAQPQPTDTVAMADPADSTPGAIKKPGASGGGPKTTTTATSKPIDPAIAALLHDNTNGPSAGPGGAGAGGGGGPLTSDQIEAVVRAHQVGVKRACWERINTQTPAVNVTAHVSVGPTGSVQNVETEGNDPMVGKCIENSIRGWQFPPTGSSSTVNIPFHFLRQ
jgi:predicted Zn finger-like uncharacterized protein